LKLLLTLPDFFNLSLNAQPVKVGISDNGMVEGSTDTKLKQQTKTSKTQKLTPQFQPLTEMEQVEYIRLQLINARVHYDLLNYRHGLNLKREAQGCVREYIK
jgi:hypothetical protein